MKRNVMIAAGVGLVVLVGAGVFLATMKPKTPVVTGDCTASTDGRVTIEYSADQVFAPNCVKIKSGETITFDNKSSKDLQVGADPHPIHSGNKEISNGEFVLPVKAGQTAEVKPTKTGTFGFHDHVHAASTGTFVVE